MEKYLKEILVFLRKEDKDDKNTQSPDTFLLCICGKM